MAQPPKNRYWLVYDLGIRGDYGELYGWLDSVGAKETGDGVATFLSGLSWEQLAEHIKKFSDGSPGARFYLISRGVGGKFIVGGRRQAPWVGSHVQAVSDFEK